MDDDLDERSGVNRPGFTLHSGVMRGRPDVQCSVHVHPEEGVAVSGLKHGLRPLSQNAMRFYNRVGYHDYEGLTDSFDERERIVAALGSNRALIMRHHGITTVGETAREAFSLMKEFVRAARIQFMMESTGAGGAGNPGPTSASTSRRSTNSMTRDGRRPNGRRIFDNSTARSRLPRLTPTARPRRAAVMSPLRILRTRAAGADAGRRRRPRRPARHQGRSARLRDHAGRRAHAAADRRGTGARRDRLGRPRLRHLGGPRAAGQRFVGITGLEHRPDGRGVALRFALWPEAQGRGLAREAAGAALRFGHDQAGTATHRRGGAENNFASRTVLGGIGMTECASFMQQG